MNLLLEGLPVTHPVLSALMIPEDRFRRQEQPGGGQRMAPASRAVAVAAEEAPESPEGSALAEITVDIYLDTNDRVAAAEGSLVWPTLSCGSLGMTVHSMKR